MKNVYIVGASDSTPDPNFPGQCWTERLESMLPENFQLYNLAFPAASNFCIRLQIDRAIEQQADAIIINFTSSVRTEIEINNQNNQLPLLERFYKRNLLSLSRIQANSIDLLDDQSRRELIQYQTKFFNLDLAVQHNFYLIRGALLDLKLHNRTTFCYSLGGFEHPDYTNNFTPFYHNKLKEFEPWQSKQNLWDYFTDWRVKTHNIVRPNLSTPGFHIDNPATVNMLSEYYVEWILKNND
jgi:hypothetical protein